MPVGHALIAVPFVVRGPGIAQGKVRDDLIEHIDLAALSLAAAGIPTQVMVAPIVPGLNDHEIERILDSGKAAGASEASYVLLRLPLEVSPLFRDWLAAHEPGRAAHVMNRVREMHGGQDYDPAFGQRMTGVGMWADLLRQRFDKAVARLGLATASTFSAPEATCGNTTSRSTIATSISPPSRPVSNGWMSRS